MLYFAIERHLWCASESYLHFAGEPYLWVSDSSLLIYLPRPQHKGNRCLARYSPRDTTTNQPTNRAPNEPARPGKNANFGPNLVVLGQKILIFTGEIKSFVPHITENPPRHLVQIFFWSGIGQHVQKMAIFGPK